jgi:N-acyl homoserine lactone hydrolase
VKLAQTGAAQRRSHALPRELRQNGVPAFNADRSQTLASLDGVKRSRPPGSKATVIIQNDARDLDKLPAFPAAAK